MKLITDSNDPRFRELSEIWGPAVHSKDMIERNGAIVVAWLMESARVALSRAEKTERELSDEKQKVANLEEYMLKGVAFRDELQARLSAIVARVEDVEKVAGALYTHMHPTGTKWEELTGTLRIIYLGEARAVRGYAMGEG